VRVIWQRRFQHYNAGPFVSNGETCLVDPGMLAEETEALVHEIEAAALVFLVLTHADWDHVLGPESLPQATTVAHESYARDLDPDGIRAVLARFEEQAGVSGDAPFDPPLPALTFAKCSEPGVGDLVLHLAPAPVPAANMH